MKIKFTKMHSTGNDFIVIDAIHQKINFTKNQWIFLANRHLGIGADQILIIEKPQLVNTDFRYRIYNADGHEVEQCGNGARAFAKFVVDKGLTSKSEIFVETISNIIKLTLETNGYVTVNMGIPIIIPSQVPFNTIGLTSKIEKNDQLWALDVHEKTEWISVVSMGNPHAILIVANIKNAPVFKNGSYIERHFRFPKCVNVSFMQINNHHNIHLRVFERGVGETLACGTGACAAVVTGIRRGILNSPVVVHTRGGKLQIKWEGLGQAVIMTGDTVSVFDGEIDL